MKNKLQVKFLLFFGFLLLIAGGFYVNTNTTYAVDLPDLYALEPYPNPGNNPGVPWGGLINTPFTVFTSVYNQGNASTSSSFTNLFQIATLANGGGTITSYPVTGMPTLSSGESAVFSKEITLSVPGLYSIRACADQTSSAGGGSVAESTETNNCSTWVNNVAIVDEEPVIMRGTLTPDPATVYPPNAAFHFCTIPEGQNSCSISFSWNTTDPAATSLVVDPYGIVVANGNSGTNVPFTLRHVEGTQGQIFALQNNGFLLDAKYGMALCASGAYWDPSSDSCKTPPPVLSDLTASAPTPVVVTANVAQTYTSTISNTGSVSTGSSFSNFFQKATAANGGGTITDLASSSMTELDASGSASTTSPSVTFASAGTYSIRACADLPPQSSGVIAESDENNNCSAWANITVTAGPVPGINLSASPTSGAVDVVNPNLSWTTTNNPTSCTATGDWANTGPKPTTSFGLPGKVESQGVLTQIKTYTYTLTCTNSYGSSSDSATVVVSAAPNPDLTASVPTPTSAASGIAQIYTSTISNTGSASTGSSFTNLFQTSLDGTTVLNEYAVSGMSALSAGGNANTQKSITFNTAGTYYVRACADKSSSADTDGSINESNENNNCSSSWAAVIVTDGATLAPDLTASAPMPTNATTDVAQVYTSTISNIGNQSTTDSFYNFFQTSDLPDGDGTITNLAPSSMSALNAGISAVSTSPSVTFPFAGLYSVRACADKSSAKSAGSIDESDEDNNCSAWTNVTVSDALPPLPDLTASAPTPDTTTAGPINFSSTVTNYGNDSTGAGFTNLFQISTFSDGSSPTNYTTNMSALAVSGSAVASKSVTLSAGTYYVRVCADNNASFVGDIDESNEGNNCSSGSPWTAVVLTDECSIYQGNPCISASNSCGQVNFGTIGCDGSCSAATPPDTSCVGNCFDEIQNGDETGVDTGGRCSVCMNGADNPPQCTTKEGSCVNGTTNPPTCKKPTFIEN